MPTNDLEHDISESAIALLIIRSSRNRTLEQYLIKQQSARYRTSSSANGFCSRTSRGLFVHFPIECMADRLSDDLFRTPWSEKAVEYSNSRTR